MEQKFVADGMLGSLARKLRIYGFNVVYDAKSLDATILSIAKGEGRIVLTSDNGLHGRALSSGLRSLFISGADDEERLAIVFKAIGMIPELDPKASKCPICNGALEKVEKGEVASKVHPSVLERFHDFYSCTRCGKVYWPGSHWSRLRRLSSRVRRRL